MHARMTLAIGSVLLAAATLVGCGGGSSSYSPAAPSPAPAPAPAPPATPAAGGADVIITIVGMNGGLSYSPSPVTVTAGQKVAWKNADNLPHTATADGGAFNTGTIAPGATSSPITMPADGSFPYHCVIHPSMTGTLTVSTTSGY